MPNITSNHAITFTSLIPLEIVASAVAQGGVLEPLKPSPGYATVLIESPFRVIITNSDP